MEGEWREVRLGDVAADLTVGHVGPMATEYVEAGIPFLRSQNVEPFRINFDDVKFITPEFHGKLTKSALREGDVVIVRTGKPGTAAVVPAGIAKLNCSDLVIVRPGPQLDSRFLCFYVNGVSQYHVDANTVGAVQQHFNVGAARALPMRLPPLAEQRTIARILGALDDKIELNRKINATLEAMARALFKSWFVDFDPVRAKAEGRAPSGMDTETAKLFPSELVESELGPIPKGWSVTSLDSMLKLLSGGTPKRSEPSYWGGEIPWFSVRDTPSQSDMFVVRTEESITDKGVSNSAAQVLPVGTTIITARGTVGKLALVGRPMAMNQSCYGARGVGGYPAFFNYFNLLKAVADLQMQTHGSVFDTITRDTFKAVRSVAPLVAITQAFDRNVEPTLLRIRLNSEEAHSLARLRDELLPRLLSGELSVADAERAVEEVA